jgi:hypothetical protein
MPMMQLGDFYKEHLTQEKIDQLIIDCKDGKIILQDSICQKKILLDKISIPGIKTYEVYRKTVVTLQWKSYESNDSDEVVEQVKHLDFAVVVVLVSCWIEMELY